MAHSIESRVPFLDHRVVEFVLGLPVDFKLSGGVTKRVLREGMKGVLPERIRTRTDKMGFVTPEEIWLRERTPDGFRRALKRAVESSRGILAPSSLDKVERILTGREPFTFGLWRLISFGAWMERFEVNGGGPRMAAG
jgi:asparagine synthase (glutamine-hydrolysing)